MRMLTGNFITNWVCHHRIFSTASDNPYRLSLFPHIFCYFMNDAPHALYWKGGFYMLKDEKCVLD
jgi:hypothetical protein